MFSRFTVSNRRSTLSIYRAYAGIFLTLLPSSIQRMKAADRKNGGKTSATTSQIGARASGEATDMASDLHQHSG